MTIKKSRAFRVAKDFISNGSKYTVGQTVYNLDPNFQLGWENDFLLFQTAPDASGNVAVGPVSAKEYLQPIDEATQTASTDPKTTAAATPGASTPAAATTEEAAVTVPWYGYAILIGVAAGLGWFTYRHWKSGGWAIKLFIVASYAGVSYKGYTMIMKKA